jgi:hypothetical protein
MHLDRLELTVSFESKHVVELAAGHKRKQGTTKNRTTPNVEGEMWKGPVEGQPKVLCCNDSDVALMFYGDVWAGIDVFIGQLSVSSDSSSSVGEERPSSGCFLSDCPSESKAVWGPIVGTPGGGTTELPLSRCS